MKTEDLRAFAAEVAAIERRGQRRVNVALLGAIVAAGLVVVGSLVALRELEQKRAELQNNIANLQTNIAAAKATLSAKENEIQSKGREKAKIETRLENVQQTVSALEAFLMTVLDPRSIHRIGPGVDWDRLKAQIRNVKPGARQTAVFVAMLTAWKEVRNVDGGSSPSTGMDSPRFLNFALRSVGRGVESFDPSVPASTQLMHRFKQAPRPEPGDLMFYRTGPGCAGVGNPGCMYLGPGKSGGEGVCVGSPYSRGVLQVMDTADFPNGCAFLGYFAVPYDQER